MKKLLLIFILFSFGCPRSQEPQDILHKVEFEIENDINPSNGRVGVSVPGFDNKFGEVRLTAYNTVYTSKWYEETANGWIVSSILLPAGNYDFRMESEGDLIFNEFMKFSSYINSDVPAANTIELAIDLSQALILITKNLDAPPTIEVSGANSSDYPVTVFYDDTNYYYIYCYGSWQYEIKYTQSEQTGNIIRVFEDRKIYTYNIGSTSIDIEEPFIEIVENQ